MSHQPSTSRARGRARNLLVATSILLAAVGCANDKPAKHADNQKSTGGESALDRAGRSIDEAHRNFQKEVRPAAEAIDEKTNTAVHEGKTAVRKTADAVTDD